MPYMNLAAQDEPQFFVSFREIIMLSESKMICRFTFALLCTVVANGCGNSSSITAVTLVHRSSIETDGRLFSNLDQLITNEIPLMFIYTNDSCSEVDQYLRATLREVENSGFIERLERRFQTRYGRFKCQRIHCYVTV